MPTQKLVALDGTVSKDFDFGGTRLLMDDLILRNPLNRIEGEVVCYDDTGQLKYDPNDADLKTLATQVENAADFLTQAEALEFLRTLITRNGIQDKGDTNPPKDPHRLKLKILIFPTSPPTVLILPSKPNNPFRSRLVGLLDHPSLNPLQPLPIPDSNDPGTWQPPAPQGPMPTPTPFPAS